MFHHVKELQFNARVSSPDPSFAKLLLEQFGGGNGELKAAMQYFTQAFSVRQAYPDKYDMLMDIATEEFSHLEIVGATITMLMGSANAELKDATEQKVMKNVTKSITERAEMIHEAATSPEFLVLSGGGPTVTNAAGVPWNGNYVNANGDLTVDLRSNIAAESRAKIVYEYLMQFTDDPYVLESLRFLMTREITHFQVFTAALDTIQPNFPPGILQGDPRFTHAYFNMSNGASARGPWNQGKGPWNDGGQWEYVDKPRDTVVKSQGLIEFPQTDPRSNKDIQQQNENLGRKRSEEIKAKVPKGSNQWSAYPQTELDSPVKKAS
jgi:Mn-containing catalase